MASSQQHENDVEELTDQMETSKITETCTKQDNGNECKNCKAIFLEGEMGFNCCSFGRIKIDDPFASFPEENKEDFENLEMRKENDSLANTVFMHYDHNQKTFEEIPESQLIPTVLKLCGKLPLRLKFDEESEINPDSHPEWLADSHPIFFPNGAIGWYEGLKIVGNEERSIREYVTYISMERKNTKFNPIHHGKLLSMQLYISSWAIFDQSQLRKYSKDQERIRDDTIKEMIGIGEIPKTRLIVPSSHEGSYRYMTEQYLDSLAIVKKFGKPDYFITFTCNRHWPFLPNSSDPAEHRPDIIARHFKTQVDRMLNEFILKGEPFGEVEAYVLAYEWQERGLPHIHMLLTMKEESKPKTPEDIDRVISAKKIGIMTHECREPPRASDATCMRHGKCKKGFPKPIQASTELINDSNNNKKWQYKRGRDDQYVASYNLTLLDAFQAHINVEACNEMTNNKLLEYLHKGSKGVGNFEWRCNSDKIKSFDETYNHLKHRILLAPEACHRLFGFPTFQRSHEVYRLPIHKDAAQITKFFEMNRKFKEREENGEDLSGEVDPRNYTYQEFPTLFKWEDGEWKERANKEEKVIGRIYTVIPTKTEEFALRCLLVDSKAPTSFEDLRTLSDENGKRTIYESFHESAEKKLLLTKEACEEALEECKMYLGPEKMKETRAKLERENLLRK